MGDEIRASAPGKLIVFGEHAVVYGEPALGIPLRRRATVTLRPGRGRVEVEPKVAPSKDAATPRSLVEAALGPLAGRLDVEIALEFPPMSGLGSSAAVAVALLRARAELEGERPSRSRLLEEAVRVEDVAHGKASGVDPAVALYEGPILFDRAGGRMHVRTVRFQGPVHLVVGSCGGHGGTRRTVGGMRELSKRARPLVLKAMAALGEITRTGTRALAGGDLALAGRAMDLAHGVLSGFGIVAPDVEAAVQAARAAGAIGAKMSGAGGAGGAFLALAKSDAGARKIARVLERAGWRAWAERA